MLVDEALMLHEATICSWTAADEHKRRDWYMLFGTNNYVAQSDARTIQDVHMARYLLTSHKSRIHKRRKRSIHRRKYVNSYIWIWTLHPSLPKIYPYSMKDLFQARPSAWALIRAPSLHWLWPSKVKCISDAPWQHLAGWVPSAFLMQHKSEQPVWDDSIRIHYGVSLRFLHSLFITINSRQ